MQHAMHSKQYLVTFSLSGTSKFSYQFTKRLCLLGSPRPLLGHFAIGPHWGTRPSVVQILNTLVTAFISKSKFVVGVLYITLVV